MPLTVELAGIPVAIEGMWPSLAAAAEARYARFGSQAAPELIVEVQPPTRAHNPDSAPTLEPTGAGVYELRYGALVGTVDLPGARVSAEMPDSVFVLDSLLRITMSRLLLERGGLLLHSSGVRVGDQVLISFGPSGAGKTTVAKSVPHERVLCDEIMALVTHPGGVRAHGTPFHGELGICAPGRGEVLAICRLHQAREARLTPLRTALAAREMLAATLFFSREPELGERLLELAAGICQGRTFSLEFALTTHVPDYVRTHLG